MDNRLFAHRLKAAEASKGTSADPIYDLVLRLCRTLGVSGRLLDFGAGTGNLLRMLFEEGVQVTCVGTDILKRPDDLHETIEWIRADLNSVLPIEDAGFDVIVSSEVIEHLENPRAVFREFHRLLKPRGLLILTTPNQESLRSYLSLLVKGHFAAFLDASYPAHITALLRRDLIRICLETGFSPPEFHYTHHGGLPKRGTVTWQSISFGLLRGRLFSDNIAMVTTTS